ncbi:MAG: MerR family transcriptional regulator [Candidatus Omnitrophota bacterium]
MALIFDKSEYTPAQLAKILSEEYGHKVTAAVIRKWDNEIFDGISSRTRGEAEARSYSGSDIHFFNAIAVLRNLGYSVNDVKNILFQVAAYGANKDSKMAKPDIVIDTGKQRIVIEIKGQMEKQKKAFNDLEKYIEIVKNK